MAITAAGFRRTRSTIFSRSSPTTIWVGRRPWRPRSWATLIAPNWGERLTTSFCATDPAIAREFAKVTFLSDNRADLALVTARTLVLQCREDIIAPIAVGEYVAGAIPGSRYVLLDATGHCPNLSAPEQVIAAIRDFVRDRAD